ncbi:MAG: hypothetical protein ACREO9_11635, partial [Lysobacterales bacterium]
IVGEAQNPTIEPRLQSLYQLNPSYGLFARASVEQQVGKIRLAVLEYYQSLEADPGRSAARADLANVLLRMGLGAEGLALDPSQKVDAPLLLGQWDEAVELARTNLALNPDQPVAIGKLMNALMWAGDAEAAFSLAQQLWARLGKNPFEVADWVDTMAWVARQSEHPQEAAQYREAQVKVVQALKEAGYTDNYILMKEARLAALDGRDDDAIAAFSRAIDRGARWTYLGNYPEFAAMQDNPGFQAQVSRVRDLMDQERGEILTMLCGPDTFLKQWTPAPETCEMYRELASTGT